MPNLKQDREEIERSLRATAEHYVQQLRDEIQRRLDELDEAARLFPVFSDAPALLRDAQFAGVLERDFEELRADQLQLYCRGYAFPIGNATLAKGRYRVLLVVTRVQSENEDDPRLAESRRHRDLCHCGGEGPHIYGAPGCVKPYRENNRG